MMDLISSYSGELRTVQELDGLEKYSGSRDTINHDASPVGTEQPRLSARDQPQLASASDLGRNLYLDSAECGSYLLSCPGAKQKT